MLLLSASVRRLVPIVVLLAACSGASLASVDTTESPVTTETPGNTAATQAEIDTTTNLASDGPSTTASGRPVAPDFTLELNDGGTYTLSEGEKPVYLVFWAEW